MLRILGACFLCTVVAASGCSKKPEPVGDAASKKPTPRAAVKLHVVVVDDGELAAGVSLVRGEWAERSGGQIEVSEITSEELLVAEQLSADLVIYPSRYVGTLVDRNWVRPIRDSLLTNSDFNFGDLLPLIRNRTMRFANQFYALSLGEPPLMLACPSDKLPENGLDRWEDLHAGLLRRISAQKHPWAVELLARTVASVSLKNDAAVMFDSRTMEPRLGEPPFEKALGEMLAIYREGNAEVDERTVGIAWPTSYSNPKEGKAKATVDFLPLPQADEVYRASRDVWEPNDARQSPAMLGFSGRSVSVLRASRNSASAFKLLLWLATGDTGIQLSQRSEGAVWFRTSQVSQAQRWLVGNNVGEGTAEAVTKLLSAENCFLLPRIPGIDEYLQTLDQAVEQAVSAETTAAEVLAAVTSKWQAITERIGVERQRKAYRQHLGFVDFAE